MDVDMRSESPAELKKIDATFKQFVAEAVDEENRARSTAQGRVAADIKLIGDRPSGDDGDRHDADSDGERGRESYGLTPSYKHRQHRLQHSDQHGHSRGHHRPRRTGRTRPLARRVDRRREEGRRAGGGSRRRDLSRDCGSPLIKMRHESAKTRNMDSRSPSRFTGAEWRRDSPSVR